MPPLALLDLPDGRVLAKVHGRPISAVCSRTPVIPGLTSNIYEVDETTLLKVCHTQSFPRNPLLRAIGKSRARIELASSRRLHAMGIATSEILATATVINPFSRIDSVLTVRRIRDGRCGIPFLNDESIPEDIRHAFVNRVIEDLVRMRAEGLALRDFRLNNIMVAGDNPTPVWIDNDLKHCLTRSQLADKLDTTLRRVIQKDIPRVPAPFTKHLLPELERLRRH